MAHHHDTNVPRGVLVAAAVLVVSTIILAVVGRVTGIGRVAMPVAALVDQRDLIFADLADGTLEVRDASNGRLVHAVTPGGHDGFLRAAMRGLARDRKRNDGGPATAFRLERWSDGRLSISDPVTSRTVDLGAFGTTNAEAFARLLANRETRS